MSTVGKHLLSGALSGFTATVILQPFDLLKTRIQQTEGSVKSRNSTISTVRTAQTIVLTNGVRGLWRGTSASLIRNVPGLAMYMTGLTYVRSMMARSPYFAKVKSSQSSATKHSSVLPTLTNQGNLIAGAATRVSIGFLLNPLSVVKARYESNMYSYTSLTSALMSIMRSGPSDLFKGFSATAIRDAPYSGLFILFYENIKREASSFVSPTSSTLSTVVHSFSAASAGAIATMATHPFDVIKTKIQVRKEDRYQGFLQTTRTIWQQRGFTGFFDGASLRLSRKVASSAISWAVYEGSLIFMRTQSIKSSSI